LPENFHKKIIFSKKKNFLKENEVSFGIINKILETSKIKNDLLPFLHQLFFITPPCRRSAS
jgi:hypothetical protein